MARFAASLKVGSATLAAERFDSVGHIPDPLNAASTPADQTTLAAAQTAFEATLATLVADGASPTQAHVTAANTAYTTMKTALATVTADITALPSVADVIVSFNAPNVVSKNALKLALDRLRRIVEGSNDLT